MKRHANRNLGPKNQVSAAQHQEKSAYLPHPTKPHIKQVQGSLEVPHTAQAGFASC